MGDRTATRESPQPRFRMLLVGHDPRDPAEATLVMAAAAALAGWTCDGDRMLGGITRAPSLRRIAAELGLHVGAVRRGVRHLVAIGAAIQDGHGVHVRPDALATRWASHRQRLRLADEDRARGMRAEPLLVAGLVAGQAGERGALTLGLGFLGERTGLPRRTLQRALAAAEQAGALHRWTAPIGRGQLVLAPGPSRSGARATSQSGARAQPSGEDPTTSSDDELFERREAAHLPIAKRRTYRREAAHHPSRSGARPSGLPPEYPSDLQSDAQPRATPQSNQVAAAPEQEPAAPAGDPIQQKPEPESRQPEDVVARWLRHVVARGVERLQPDQHAGTVAELVAAIGGQPEHIRDRRAHARAQLALGRQVCRWCPSPERLARWLVRVHRRFGPTNLAAYLRRASERGDPGTVVDSGGRQATNVRDFDAETERALIGPQIEAVAALVAGGAAVMASVDTDERERLRAELRNLIATERPAAARAVLLRLVGSDRSDVGLMRAIGDACTVGQARALLVAA